MNLTKISFQKAALSLGLDPQTSGLMQSYLKPVGIGAGIGALGLGAADALGNHDDEQPGDRTPNLLKSMALGGALGGGAGALVKGMDHATSTPPIEEIYNKIHGVKGYDGATALKSIPAHPLPTAIGVGTAAHVAAGNRVPGISTAIDRFKGVTPPKAGDIKTDKIKATGLDTEGSDPFKATVEADKKLKVMGEPVPGQAAPKGDTWADKKKAFQETHDASQAQVRALADKKTGTYSRDALRQLQTSFADNNAKPFDETKTWNPRFANSAGKLNSDNMRVREISSQLGGGANQMSWLQKLEAAAKNLYGSFNKEQGSYFDPTPNKVDPAKMPWWTKGFGMHDAETGLINKGMHLPESIPTSVAAGGKMPWHYGTGRYAAGPLAGLGTYYGMGKLDNAIKGNDAEGILQYMKVHNPELYQQSMQQAQQELATHGAPAQ